MGVMASFCSQWLDPEIRCISDWFSNMYEQRKRTKSQDHSWIEAWWRGRADVFRDQQRVRWAQRRGERREERAVGSGLTCNWEG